MIRNETSKSSQIVVPQSNQHDIENEIKRVQNKIPPQKIILSTDINRPIQIQEIPHKCIIIKIKQKTIDVFGSVYEAVRCAWKIDLQHSKRAEYVLAVTNGIICGVFKADSWYQTIEGNILNHNDLEKCRKCPNRSINECKTRYGFEGHDAESNIKDYYLNKQIPDYMFKSGAQNPVTYSFK